MQTDRRTKRLGLALAVLTVVVLALPSLRWLALQRADGALYGYADQVPTRPPLEWKAIRDRSLQRWVEKAVDVGHGFRAILIRSFNEVNFRLFSEAPKLLLYSTASHGLYSRMSLDSLFDQTVHRAALERSYRAEAAKLLRIQHLLASQQKVFAVVIGASKPYVYPEDLGPRFFKGSVEDPLSVAASFGDILKAEGVNVVDGDRYLRDFAKRTGVQTHADAGVHWNYYAGCLIAGQVVDLARARLADRLSKLECGEPTMMTPRMVDIDGWSLLNVWSTVGLYRATAYPTLPAAAPVSADAPRFLLVNDSFADQIVHALRATGSYSRMVLSGYFRSRVVDDRVTPSESVAPSDGSTDDEVARSQVLDDMTRSDVVLLEMVDYNIFRLGYGFADYVLAHVDRLNRIPHGAATGAYGTETDGTNTWNWVPKEIRFEIDRFVATERSSRTRVRFEYATTGPRTLDCTVTLRDGGRRDLIIHSSGAGFATFDEVLDVDAGRVAAITLSSDGEPSPIGPNDPRKVSWILRNFTIESSPAADR